METAFAVVVERNRRAMLLLLATSERSVGQRMVGPETLAFSGLRRLKD